MGRRAGAPQLPGGAVALAIPARGGRTGPAWGRGATAGAVAEVEVLLGHHVARTGDAARVGEADVAAAELAEAAAAVGDRVVDREEDDRAVGDGGPAGVGHAGL